MIMRSIILAGALILPAASHAAPVAAPAAFDVAGREPLLVVQGAGVQVYQCKADAKGQTVWTFSKPIATLIADGKAIGRHYAGPTWELDDGGRVRGKALASAPGAGPGDVPWLKLQVIENRRAGVLKGANIVLRLNTHGGNLSGPCPDAGELREEPYSADYAFLP